MTEAEWLKSENPEAMLLWLTADRRAEAGIWPLGYKPATDRKLALFVAACCDLRYSRKYSDYDHPADYQYHESGGNHHLAIEWAGVGDITDTFITKAERADIVRCIFGNPWRQVKTDAVKREIRSTTRRIPPMAHPMVPVQELEFRDTVVGTFSWLTTTVVQIARSAYDDKAIGMPVDSQQLAVLADAAEESGRRDEALLRHLREDKQHFRGCYALDLILGKS